jgi:hypothetical protein
MKQHELAMNKLLVIAAALFCFQAAAQNSAPPMHSSPAAPTPFGDAATPVQPAEPLTRFDLDFNGGTPRELVRAIEKASGIPVNAIVPEEHAQVQIPPLKMNSVDIAELFQALELASRKMVTYSTGVIDYGGVGSHRKVLQQFPQQFGFKTQGPVRDSSIWYFYYEKPVLPEEEKTCRFWQLEPYLTAYKIEDITTAVQTGYKMLDEPPPTISFHKDTKLLIAVGEANKLALIDSVLRELPRTSGAGSTGSTPFRPANPELPSK